VSHEGPGRWKGEVSHTFLGEMVRGDLYRFQGLLIPPFQWGGFQNQDWGTGQLDTSTRGRPSGKRKEGLVVKGLEYPGSIGKECKNIKYSSITERLGRVGKKGE